MPHRTSTQWSKTLREATCHALRDGAVTPDRRIHMKHIDGRLGWCRPLDLLSGTYVLHHKGSGESASFFDEEAVVAAGWVIDGGVKQETSRSDQ